MKKGTRRTIIPTIIFVILLSFILLTIKEAVDLAKATMLQRKLSILIQKENKRTFREREQLKRRLDTQEAEHLIFRKIAEERRQTVIDLRVVNEVVWIYQEAGTTKDNPWATPQNIEQSLHCIRKWKHLSGLKEKPNFDVEAYCLAWIMTESHFCPNNKEQNTNGTWDFGIMRLNEKCMCWFKGDDWRNPEYNIKAWMLWANDRINRGWSLRPKNRPLRWDYYDRIVRVKVVK